MSQYENPWTYDNKIFDSDLIGDYYGFVYLITGKQTGRRYIGCLLYTSDAADE